MFDSAGSGLLSCSGGPYKLGWGTCLLVVSKAVTTISNVVFGRAATNATTSPFQLRQAFTKGTSYAPESKVHGANMGPSGADRTQVGLMLARGLCYLGLVFCSCVNMPCLLHSKLWRCNPLSCFQFHLNPLTNQFMIVFEIDHIYWCNTIVNIKRIKIHCSQRPLLPTRINFNPSVDK